LNDIVLGRRAVTTDTALRLGRYFGTTPEFWLRLQTRYDLDVAERSLRGTIEREITPRDVRKVVFVQRWGASVKQKRARLFCSRLAVCHQTIRNCFAKFFQSFQVRRIRANKRKTLYRYLFSRFFLDHSNDQSSVAEDSWRDQYREYLLQMSPMRNIRTFRERKFFGRDGNFPDRRA